LYLVAYVNIFLKSLLAEFLKFKNILTIIL